MTANCLAASTARHKQVLHTQQCHEVPSTCAAFDNAIVCKMALDSCSPLFWTCPQQAALVARTSKLQPAEGMRWQIPTTRTLQTPLQMGLGLTVRLRRQPRAVGEHVSWRLLLLNVRRNAHRAARAMLQYGLASCWQSSLRPDLRFADQKCTHQDTWNAGLPAKRRPVGQRQALRAWPVARAARQARAAAPARQRSRQREARCPPRMSWCWGLLMLLPPPVMLRQ